MSLYLSVDVIFYHGLIKEHGYWMSLSDRKRHQLSPTCTVYLSASRLIKTMSNYTIMNSHNPITLFTISCLIFITSICFSQTASSVKKMPNKINGISFLGPKSPNLTPQMIESVKSAHANWIALIPEATLNRYTLQLRPDTTNDHWSETIIGNIQAIQYAKAAGLKVMLKPHIVLSKSIQETAKSGYINYKKKQFPLDKTGKAYWRGEFKAINERDWSVWEQQYESYLLKLAKIADSLEVELFCVGTELKEFAVKRAQFWRQLIQKVRQNYQGKITYAANWDEYTKISFWADLDFIGINTYIPINKAKVPTVDKTLKTWQIHLKQIRKISKQFQRPILITEFGYRNIEYAGRQPWRFDFGYDQLNNQAQVNLYEAFFQAFWKKKWVIGGFLWHWDYLPQPINNTDFSPQGKPALEVIKKWYQLKVRYTDF